MRIEYACAANVVIKPKHAKKERLIQMKTIEKTFTWEHTTRVMHDLTKHINHVYKLATFLHNERYAERSVWTLNYTENDVTVTLHKATKMLMEEAHPHEDFEHMCTIIQDIARVKYNEREDKVKNPGTLNITDEPLLNDMSLVYEVYGYIQEMRKDIIEANQFLNKGDKIHQYVDANSVFLYPKHSLLIRRLSNTTNNNYWTWYEHVISDAIEIERIRFQQTKHECLQKQKQEIRTYIKHMNNHIQVHIDILQYALQREPIETVIATLQDRTTLYDAPKMHYPHYMKMSDTQITHIIHMYTLRKQIYEAYTALYNDTATIPKETECVNRILSYMNINNGVQTTDMPVKTSNMNIDHITIKDTIHDVYNVLWGHMRNDMA